MNLKNKKILITGADGFIGSHLTEMLLDQVAKVKALSFYNSFNNWGWLEDLKCLNDIELLTGDIRDPHFCNKISKSVDIIFHLAALVAIPYSYIAPDSYVDTNIKGTLNICQSAIESGCKRVIHTSTSEVYGTARYVPIDENHPLQPQSPYSASKIGADAIAMSFYNAFNLPVVIARPFNTYGPRQSARAIIPTIIAQIASGKKDLEVGNLTPTRDFNYVKDTCSGLIALAKCEESLGNAVNIGSNQEISIEKLIYLIKGLMQSDVNISIKNYRMRPEKSEVNRLWCDNKKITDLTDFAPKFSLREGLKHTIDWFLNSGNLKKYKVNLYNV